MARRERSYRGISTRAAIGYLENLGGERVDAEERVDGDGEVDETVAGDGWTAALSAEKVEIGPSLKLTEVTVHFEGEGDVLDPLIEKFSQKAIRAGG